MKIAIMTMTPGKLSLASQTYKRLQEEAGHTVTVVALPQEGIFTRGAEPDFYWLDEADDVPDECLKK